AAFLCAEIGAGQEDLADGDQLVHVRLVPGPAHLVVKEPDRDLNMDAGTVTGLAVGVYRAPVPDRLQRIDAVLNDLARWLAVDRDDKTHTAGGMLVLVAEKPVLGQPVAAGVFVTLPCRAEFGHGASPSICWFLASYSARVARRWSPASARPGRARSV